MPNTYIRYPHMHVNAYVRCVYPVHGLRYGAVYRVLEVLIEDWFYFGKTVRVFDIEAGQPAPDNQHGYWPWRFEAVSGLNG